MNRSFVRTRRPHAKPEERAHWVEQYHKSGLTQREFARHHGLVLSTLQRWLRQERPSESSALFAEVKLPAPSGRWAAEVLRTDGMLVRLAHDAPSSLVQQLLPAC